MRRLRILRAFVLLPTGSAFAVVAGEVAVRVVDPLGIRRFRHSADPRRHALGSATVPGLCFVHVRNVRSDAGVAVRIDAVRERPRFDGRDAALALGSCRARAQFFRGRTFLGRIRPRARLRFRPRVEVCGSLMDRDRDDADAVPLPVETHLRLARRFLLGLALGLSLAQQTFLTSYRIAGNSMTPAFLDGDRVVVARTPGIFGEPHCGEAVIAEVQGEVVIKRIAAAPGDVVSLAHGVLCRNGAPVTDPIPASYRDASDFGPERLGGAEYFLLGDHRRVSIDSREFGPVDREHILGRVILRVPQQQLGPQVGAAERRPSH